MIVAGDPGGLPQTHCHEHVHDFSRNQTTRCLHTYKTYLSENNFIKQHVVVQTKGHKTHMDIIFANITSLSDSARQWLSEQTAEIILLQEHRALTLREFGKIPGYDVIFSTARRTICSDRWFGNIGWCGDFVQDSNLPPRAGQRNQKQGT